jgi:uncharacterized protein with HEPN domain
MPSVSREVELYLQDIATCAAKVVAYTHGMDFDAFLADDRTYDAVLRNLELIGEAAKHVPESFRNQHPAIDWRRMSGLRDILAHAYFGVDDLILWDLVRQKIPALVAAMAGLKEDPPASRPD